MNIRQQKYKANRIAGMNQYNAARAAGYSETTSRNHSDRLERVMKGDIQDALEQAGITDKFQAQRLFELINSKNQKTAVSAIRLSYDLKGHIKQKHEHKGLPNTTVNVHPNKTIIFQGINETNEKRISDLKDIYAIQSEDSSRIGAEISNT